MGYFFFDVDFLADDLLLAAFLAGAFFAGIIPHLFLFEESHCYMRSNTLSLRSKLSTKR